MLLSRFTLCFSFLFSVLISHLLPFIKICCFCIYLEHKIQELHSLLSHINSSALSQRIYVYLQVQVFGCAIIFIERKVMDVTCTAITLIYLIICFLPFYATVSFHFSLLFLYIFLSFFFPSPFIILPVMQRLYSFFFQFWGSPFYFIFYLPLVYICPLILLFMLFGFAFPPSPSYFSN